MVFTHMPLQHVEPLAQAWAAPHAPQLFSSSWVLTHFPAQQTSVPVHAIPHAPQFARSVCKSKVSSTLPLQSSSTPLQLSAAGACVMHASSAPLHSNVPLRHAPLLLATLHGAPRFTTLSATPSQLSSAPSFPHVSVCGMTAPSHVPSIPLMQS
jgi:hypothetical protein